jgi:hypothetical protein
MVMSNNKIVLQPTAKMRVALALLAFLTASPQLRADERVETAIRVITTFCISGGGVEESRISALNFDQFNKREAQGLVDGINAQLSNLAADQANRAREYASPY